jgi:hypothetical protein
MIPLPTRLFSHWPIPLRTKNKEHKLNTHQQVVSSYNLACKSSQGTILSLILLDVFLLQSV